MFAEEARQWSGQSIKRPARNDRSGGIARVLLRFKAAIARRSGLSAYLPPAQGATDQELVEIARWSQTDGAEGNRLRALNLLYGVDR